MADSDSVRLGRLRWRVLLATRQQLAQISGTGIDDRLLDLQPVWADIQPVSGSVFYGSAQVDTPVTHRITLRWLADLTQATVIVRQTMLPSGQVRTEVYRIRRIKEMGGRKRFIEVEAELEGAKR